MIQETNKNNEYAEILNDGFDEELLAEFPAHLARSLRIGFNHQNIVQTVANQLTVEVAERLTGDVAENENFSVEEEAERILDKHKISHAADATFVTTAVFSELTADDIRLARSYFNAANVRQEIQRITNRFGGDDWQMWLRQTANETAQEIHQDLSFLPLQRQHDGLAFVTGELRQLLTRLSARQNECTERQMQFVEQQQNNRQQQQNAQNINNQPNEPRGNLFARMRRGAGNLLDLNRYFPGRGRGMAQNQPIAMDDNFDPIESFLAQTEFEIATNQIESTFYNELLDVLVSYMQMLEVSLTNSRKKYAELSAANAKLETKRSFGLHGGEMLLNSSELTKATIRFLAPDDRQKEFLLAELREKISLVIEECDGDVRDSDVEEMSRIIADVVAEKLSDFYIADAMRALLEFQPTFETQIHEAINQTVATDFLSSGWYQFLTPKLNYFAAVSYLPSVYAETNERLTEVIERIAASLHLRYEMKNETFDSNRADFCFYIEYFCLPVESLEFYEPNIREFEKVKDLPEFNPHFDLYK